MGIYEIEPCAGDEGRGDFSALKTTQGDPLLCREHGASAPTILEQSKDGAAAVAPSELGQDGLAGHPGTAPGIGDRKGLGSAQGEAELSPAPLRFHKRKYKIQSHLYNVIPKSPRKYIYRFLGKDILRRYYTMPFRPSMSRFISTKVLRSCCSAFSGGGKNMGRKTLLDLCQKASGRKAALSRNVPFMAEKKHAATTEGSETNEVAKNSVQSSEERSDSSLLRLLHLKPLYSSPSAKRALAPGAAHFMGPFQGRRGGREAKVTRYSKYQIKAPWANFSAKQVRQMISHGHIRMNGRKVKSPNTRIRR